MFRPTDRPRSNEPVWSKYSAAAEKSVAICLGSAGAVRISAAACLNLAELGGSIGTESGDIWRTEVARRRKLHDGFCAASVAVLADWIGRVDQPQPAGSDRILTDGESSVTRGHRQETDSAQRRSATAIGGQREDAGAPEAARTGGNRVWSKTSAASERSVAICLGSTGPVRISAASFGAFGAELRGEDCDSRGLLFQRIATSTLIADFDTAEFFDHTGTEANSAVAV